jgi:hypothetical protein
VRLRPRPIPTLANNNLGAPSVPGSLGPLNNGTTASASATANLTASPAAADSELVFQTNIGDAGGPGNPSSPQFTLIGTSYLHGGGGAGGSVSAFFGSAQTPASVTLNSSQIWGTLSIEIAHA